MDNNLFPGGDHLISSTFGSIIKGMTMQGLVGSTLLGGAAGSVPGGTSTSSSLAFVRLVGLVASTSSTHGR